MQAKLFRSLVCWGVMLPVLFLILFPIVVMFLTSLKAKTEVFAYPIRWLPKDFQWSNYAAMWDATGFGQALVNSLYVAGASTLCTLFIAIPMAYAIARYRFRGRGLVNQFLLITQMLSPIVLVVGLFKLIAYLGLIDQLNSLVLCYTAFNLAFCVWMLQNYFATIPKDLEEAAWLEGCGHVRAVIGIFLPLALPAVVVAAIFTFVMAWNEFVIALSVLRSQEKYTLTLQVHSLVGGRYSVEWHHVMGASLLAILPVAAVFAWLQKYLIEGLALGAVK